MTDIEKYIVNNSGSKFYFMPNPGNAGDSLINLATYQVLRKCGCEFSMVDPKDDLEGMTVLYGGGGNFVNYYANAADFVSRWHEKASKLIVLPHTISGHENLIRSLGPNVDLICRERKSFDYLSGLTIKANVLLMDDMAFGLDISFLQDYKDNRAGSSNSGKAHRSTLPFLGKLFKDISSEEKKLNSFRNDKESTDISIPADNIDVSRLLKSGDMSEKWVMETSILFLNFLDHYDQINTNRLHVCIAGILLKKRVNFYPNAYYKNEAIYHFSMKDKFNNVKWMG
jgi:exopolysaccharide biosynthesis predicted pyruvyltransferase EpsI